MILSIYLYAYSPFVYLSWRNMHSSLSPMCSPPAQGLQKQNCYKTVFQKGLSSPMGQLKRFLFTLVKWPWPFLHLQVTMGTHVYTHMQSIHHKLLQTKSVNNYPLEHFHYYQNSSRTNFILNLKQLCIMNYI